jgi:hypothetical protein
VLKNRLFFFLKKKSFSTDSTTWTGPCPYVYGATLASSGIWGLGARAGPAGRVRAFSVASPKAFSKPIWGAEQKKFPAASPKSVFCPAASRYGVRRPESVPAPQVTHRGRRTQQKARRSDAGLTRQRHNKF